MDRRMPLECNDHCGDLNECFGDGKNRIPLITYKYLELDSSGQFVSPVAKTRWENHSMSGKSQDEDEPRDWIWSCLTADNPALSNYDSETAVLVTLQVWGKVLIDHLGVVRSQGARIVAYDSGDYYYAQLMNKKIDVCTAAKMISPFSRRYLDLVKNFASQISADILGWALQQNPDPWLAFYSAKAGLLEKEAARRLVCGCAETAFYFARDVDCCSHDETRRAVCQRPEWAYAYALEVDRWPCDDTRRATCGSPRYAYLYAVNVDKSANDETRLATCQDSHYAYMYAKHVDGAPSELTRRSAVCQPGWAYWYALEVDGVSRDDTRAGACVDPWYAYLYARDVDGYARDDTRNMACQSPSAAYWYAVNMDGMPRDDTRRGACQSPQWAYRYALEVDRCPREDTRLAACSDPEYAYRYATEVDRTPHFRTRLGAYKDSYYLKQYSRWENHLNNSTAGCVPRPADS